MRSGCDLYQLGFACSRCLEVTLLDGCSIRLFFAPVKDVNTLAGELAVEVDFAAFGQQCRWTIVAEDRPVALGDMVPPAWSIAEGIHRLSELDARKSGERISCRRGCSACCNYLVSMSPPEVFRLMSDIERLPDYRRDRLMARLLGNAKRIIGFWPAMEAFQSPSQSLDDPDGLHALSKWYDGMNLVCPLLEGSDCFPHEARPLACREHTVTSPPLCCNDPAAETSVVKLPVSMVEALAILAAQLEGTEVDSIMMPLAPAWADVNAERAKRTWPAKEVLDRFVAIVERLAEGYHSAELIPAKAG